MQNTLISFLISDKGIAWKNTMAPAVLGRDEYAGAAPAVQAHFHAVRAEDAFRQSNVRAVAASGRSKAPKLQSARRLTKPAR